MGVSIFPFKENYSNLHDLTYCWCDKKLAYFQKIKQAKLLIILKLSKYVNNNT